MATHVYDQSSGVLRFTIIGNYVYPVVAHWSMHNRWQRTRAHARRSSTTAPKGD